MSGLSQIDFLYAQARALEGAAQAAATLALQGGASAEEVREALDRAVGDAPKAARGEDRLGQAERHLAGRRSVCLAVTRLALKYGQAPAELLESLTQAGESAAHLRLAYSPSDLI